MSAGIETLIQELLHNVTASGNRVLERRLADTAIWFYKNKDSISRDNLAARQAFLEKAFWIAIEIMALQTERIHELEQKGKPQRLWTVSGLNVGGDVRRFG